MSRIVTNFMRTTISVLGIGLLLCARVNAQACLGDCNGNGSVTAGELTKIIAIIGLCDSMATGCGAVAGGCVNADKNNNGTISAGELTNIISNILNFPPSGCPASTTPGATNTPAVTNTPLPGNTATRTFTVPPSPTPTATSPVVAAVCGNGVKEGDEGCDDGGTCIGGPNAGTPCTAEGQCQGDGVCVGGPHVGAACADSSTCGSGQCLRCVPFGGDGCAANCTTETDVPVTFLPGVQVKQCNGGANAGMTCTSNSACGTGFTCDSIVKPGTTGSFVHGGIVKLPIPLSGGQVVTGGKLRNGMLTFIVKGPTLKIPAIKVGTLACACVRGIAPKTCGGTLFNLDGSFTTNCTPDYTAGASLCAGKNPCTFVLGAGNSSSGTVDCSGLDGVNLSFTQESVLSPPYPPPGTPPVGSKPPVITLTGAGPPGSVLTINSAAIGTTTETHVAGDVCTGIPSTGTTCPGSTFGTDCKFCTDDDPQANRGAAAPLPQVSGTATGEIFNSQSTLQADHNLGPFTVTGNALDCSKLTTTPPQLSGQTVVGAFTQLNPPATNDIVVTSTFIVQ